MKDAGKGLCGAPLWTVCVGIVNRMPFRGKIPRFGYARHRDGSGSRVLFLSQHNYIPELFLGQAAASL